MEYIELLNNPIMVIVLVILTTWRVSFMIVSEDGAFSITYAIRLLGASPVDKKISKFDAWKNNLKPAGSVGYKSIPLELDNHLGKLLHCIYCTSVWIGLLSFIGLYFYQFLLVKLFYVAMSLSATTIIISKKGA